MPKRKKDRSCEEDLEHLMRKMRKLERKIRDRDTDSASVLIHETAITPPNDWLLEDYDPGIPCLVDIDITEINDDYPAVPSTSSAQPQDEVAQNYDNILPAPDQSVSTANQPQKVTLAESELDPDALEILGEDPALAQKRGTDILLELACRLQHVASEGLNKDIRKELTLKYPLPANCLRIDAPKLNPEIKVAVNETTLKRDKGIEIKQKQMASAISCLADVITTLLNSKDKNKDMLCKLMDLSRLLCDIQHGDSITRRNFVLFTIKKELKEHLTNTKVDSYLFSESLTDTLKSAKTINKMAQELQDNSNKITNKRQKPPLPKNLNRKPLGPVYRPPGPPQRNYESAAPRTYFAPGPAPPPPPPPRNASRPSARQPPRAPPRRY